MDYDVRTGYETVFPVSLREECWVIDFEEKDAIPEGYNAVEYDLKGFRATLEM